jgi:tRNA dimethylallyltransferase
MTRKLKTIKQILVVVGPTATNKTQLSIKLANEFDGEIINADAFQVYKELNIGVNKPSAKEMTLAKFHLIGTISINQK